jgi:hypothetical protein
MRQPGTRELLDYWNRLRAGRDAPERSEIDLAAIRGLLHDIFMLEVDAGHRFPFVMSGSRVNALFCAEQKSRSFLDFWPLREAHNMAAVLLTVVDAACPVVVCAEARPEGYAKADVEILLLPLHHNGHAQARILGVLSTAAKPTWLGLLPSQQLTLRSLRAIDDTVLPVITPLGAQFSGPRRLEATEIRRHLRVFQGGK